MRENLHFSVSLFVFCDGNRSHEPERVTGCGLALVNNLSLVAACVTLKPFSSVKRRLAGLFPVVVAVAARRVFLLSDEDGLQERTGAVVAGDPGCEGHPAPCDHTRPAFRTAQRWPRSWFPDGGGTTGRRLTGRGLRAALIGRPKPPVFKKGRGVSIKSRPAPCWMSRIMAAPGLIQCVISARWWLCSWSIFSFM